MERSKLSTEYLNGGKEAHGPQEILTAAQGRVVSTDQPLILIVYHYTFRQIITYLRDMYICLILHELLRKSEIYRWSYMIMFLSREGDRMGWWWQWATCCNHPRLTRMPREESYARKKGRKRVIMAASNPTIQFWSHLYSAIEYVSMYVSEFWVSESGGVHFEDTCCQRKRRHACSQHHARVSQFFIFFYCLQEVNVNINAKLGLSISVYINLLQTILIIEKKVLIITKAANSANAYVRA